MKKISSSMLKSLWLFAVVLAIMLANGLPLWILISVLIVLLALPLVRELTHKAQVDERQIFISGVALILSFLERRVKNE
ncbi:MAG TPA: hypothetical protein EYP36_01910 [Calditrichaeota bacterium]|nr:hypothetical protein [Calditrichota bacterium]